MTGCTRELPAGEAGRLWPVVAGSHVFPSREGFVRFCEEGAWRVRISDHGDAYVIRGWRAHLDMAALLGVWAPPRRVPDLVGDACAVAAGHGFSRLMSPLLHTASSGPYRESGMRPLEELVAFSVSVDGLRAGTDAEYRVRVATEADVDDIVALDAVCFEPIWRHGRSEVEEALSEGAHVTLVRGEDGMLLGSAISALSASVVTVGRLATAPAARRRGVARRLLADARDWARTRGALGLSLCTQAANEAARRLYRSAGFKESSERYVLLVTSCT